jgi:shikimate dehydrogenase
MGFSAAVRRVIPDLRGTRMLIVGAGGGARAVLYAALAEGCDAVTVLARDRKRAREIKAVAGRRAGRVAFQTEVRDEGFDLVVNTTPLGMRATDALPLRLSKLGALTAVFDIVYQPGGTKWVNYARSLGIPAEDGAEMLVQQAAASFELWFDQPAPVSIMRRAFGA